MVHVEDNDSTDDVRQYYVKVIKDEENIIIGEPTDRRYKRFRIDTQKQKVKLYEDDKNIKERELSRMDNFAPTWVDDYFS